MESRTRSLYRESIFDPDVQHRLDRLNERAGGEADISAAALAEYEQRAAVLMMAYFSPAGRQLGLRGLAHFDIALHYLIARTWEDQGGLSLRELQYEIGRGCSDTTLRRGLRLLRALGVVHLRRARYRVVKGDYALRYCRANLLQDPVGWLKESPYLGGFPPGLRLGVRLNTYVFVRWGGVGQVTCRARNRLRRHRVGG